jgi:sec-independent protein translocase protein TatC
MSFWDHLEVLRGTLFRSILYVFVAALLCFSLKDILFKVVFYPSREDFFLYRFLHWKVNVDLINTDVVAQFFVHLKVACLVGLVMVFPLVIWEIWKFIAPALYENEKKVVRGAFMMASVLFYLGVACGYCFVLPVCLQFFMNYSVGESVTNLINLNSYISLFISMVFMIGLVFEFPSVIAVLSHFGIVTSDILKQYRKHAFVVVLILAALITPADPLSMFVLAIPLYGLYEFSISRCKPAIEDDDNEEDGE